MRIRVLAGAALICLCGGALCAQTPASATPPAPPQANLAKGKAAPSYAGQPFVYESIVAQETFHEDGSSTEQVSARIRVQSAAGVQQLSVINFPYASASSKLHVSYVRVIHPDGSVIDTPASVIQDMPAAITREAPLYSDLREMEVPVSSLAPGDELEYEARTDRKSAWLGKNFILNYRFVRSNIVLDQELEVRVPADRYVNIRSPGLKPVVTHSGNEIDYSWKTSNLKIPSGTSASASAPPPSVEVTTFRSWAEVGQWYQALAQPQAALTPTIRAKAEALTQGMTEENKKFRAIYDYVSLDIRYVGIDFGIGRFRPHSADEILKNGYGDCKDKVTLLTALLSAVGIQAYPALINTSAKVDSSSPSPGQFNHLVAVIPQASGNLWLDTTVGVAPPGFLIASLRGKEALVISNAGPAGLESTPSISPIPDTETFQANAKLSNDGILDSKMQLDAQGDTAVLFRLLFREVPQASWKNLMQGVSERLGFGGTVSNVTASQTESTDADFQIQYDYERKNYSDWSSSRQITAPLPPITLPQAGSQTSTTPVDLGSPSDFHFEASVTMPPGYVPSLPSAVNRVESFAEYHAVYSFAGGALHVDRHLITKGGKVPPADRSDYQAFVKAVSNDASIFMSFTSAAAGAPSAAPYIPSKAARDLYDEGRQEVNQGNFNGAADYFQKAAAADPKFALAWSSLGLCHVLLGDRDQGIEEMKKAIAISPHSAAYYVALAREQMALKQSNAALETWRKLQKEDPSNPDAPANIGSLLLSLHRYGDAVAPLEAAVKLGPTALIMYELGTAYLNSDATDKAMTAFQQALRLNPSSQTMSDVAYALASKNVHLDVALSYAQKAVQEAEAGTAQLTLDSLTYASLQSVPALASDWDTLGWVDFRQGRLKQAENYTDAAWLLSSSPVIADHLGQIYQKEGKVHAAAQLYAMALGAARLDLQSGTGKPTSEKASSFMTSGMSETRQRLQKLLKGPARATRSVSDAGIQLSQLRTVHLFKVTRKSAQATFFLLFAPGPKLIGVKFLSGASALRTASAKLAAAHFNLPFPDAGPERIVRKAIVDCEPAMSGCVIVFETPDSVHSLQ